MMRRPNDDQGDRERWISFPERLSSVYTMPLGSLEKHVLAALWCVGEEHHRDHPQRKRSPNGIGISERKLAARCSFDRRTLRRVVRGLVEKDALATRPGTGTAPTLFFVNFLYGQPGGEDSFRRHGRQIGFARQMGATDAQIRAPLDNAIAEREQRMARRQKLNSKCASSTADDDDDGGSPFDEAAPDDPEGSPF